MSKKVHRLAIQVASIYGESLTEAVTVALRERFARATAENRLDRMRSLAREISARIPVGMTRESADEMLYTGVGFPR